MLVGHPVFWMFVAAVAAPLIAEFPLREGVYRDRVFRIVGPKGAKIRLIDGVDVITGVSGGSFTALAYGLYGDKLFADYEQRFLKRDVQGELIARAVNPGNWGALSSTGWGRSELAAQLYDEILFNGATFGDLDRGDGPFVMVSATDISTGTQTTFTQNIFNVLCSNLDAVRLSRAAALGIPRFGRASWLRSICARPSWPALYQAPR